LLVESAHPLIITSSSNSSSRAAALRMSRRAVRMPTPRLLRLQQPALCSRDWEEPWALLRHLPKLQTQFK
jgi:hypothetical protein